LARQQQRPSFRLKRQARRKVPPFWEELVGKKELPFNWLEGLGIRIHLLGLKVLEGLLGKERFRPFGRKRNYFKGFNWLFLGFNPNFDYLFKD